ncbi:hypothetical protein MAA_06334 [Metarhizium robertsii ARSEF 23]|uniref:Uncharacterized protein n=1 Tax=Metarhizium robertsii (strain ARSEF 23 / ATCC MYA-3075) TaxID=655844 RepID=E9F2D6_METRA|nr:uncharacterized protein MAA_06334 [Metarhizium robertsii ARSEF 23]EFY98225.1 hypothetical protein MAA_06334 [Metarhizium robertsii ARSEF 23]
MIRPQGLRRAATALPPSSSIPSRTLSSTTPTQADPQWPLLKKRASPPNQQDTIHSGGTSLIESLKNRQPQTPSAADPASSPASLDTTSPKPDSRLMLILHGLSPHLNASDFYRLAPSDLSSWQSVIKKVQQQRNPTTLEPLGRYHISFSTSTAAISYRDRLLRLHKLAHYKIRSPGGLWESSTPRHLTSPAGEDPAAELETYTVTSGTQRTVDAQRRRASGGNKWAQRLAGAVGGLGHGGPRPRGEAAGGAGPRVPPDTDGRRPGRAHCRGRPVEGLRVEGVSAAGAAGRAGGASYGQGIIPRESPRRRRAATHAAGY